MATNTGAAFQVKRKKLADSQRLKQHSTKHGAILDSPVLEITNKEKKSKNDIAKGPQSPDAWAETGASGQKLLF